MIVASCVKFKPYGFRYWQYCTAKRHASAYDALSMIGLSLRNAEVVEGFMTDEDKFVNRHEATFIAKECGQISTDFNEFNLYSEDIWPEDE